MDPNLSVHHAGRAVRHWKERLVSQGGVGTDIPPAVVTLNGPMLIGAHDLSVVHGPARDASVVAAIALSDCDWAVVIFEAYLDVHMKYPTGTELAPFFAAGDPAVAEAVVFSFVDRRGYTDARLYPYTYGAGRKVQWEAPASLAAARNIVTKQHRVMGEGFKAQAERPGPPLLAPGANLEVVGVEACEHMAVVSFAVSAPCPCGSGRPIEECCALRN